MTQMQNTQKNNISVSRIMDDTLLQDILYRCLRNWYWFVLSVIVALGLAVFKFYRIVPEYTRSMSLLINDYAKGTSSSTEEQFQRMGMFFTRTTIANEIQILTSVDISRDVVTRMDLQTDYYYEGRLHNAFLYGSDLAVQVKFLDMAPNASAKFNLEVSRGKVHVSNVILNGQDAENTVYEGMLMDTLSTSMGRVIVAPNVGMGSTGYAKVLVVRKSYNAAVAEVRGRLSVARQEKESNILAISYVDKSPEKAENVLNEIIEVYNERWVKDRNNNVIKTSLFVSDRLKVIEGELGDVENEITRYKSENLITDLGAADMYLTQVSQAETRISELNNQVYMAKYIRNTLASTLDKNQLLPANSGIIEGGVSSQITAYNEMILKRAEIVAASSENNPILVEYDDALKNYRDVMIKSIDNEIIALEKQIQTLEKISKEATNQIASSPEQRQYLLSATRQQKVKEALYLFLLQKREENELSQAFSAYNTRVISSPTGSNSPSYPILNKFLMIAFLIGFAFPLAIFVLCEIKNTKVRGKVDIEKLSIPNVGEIPMVRKTHRKKMRKMLDKLFNRIKTGEQIHPIVVKNRSRNSINEAFRVVRTNLEFICASGDYKVIMTTSANPGSGKTFISANLSTSFVLKEKKVIAVDLDLRRASLSGYVDNSNRGVSTYLAGLENDYTKLIAKMDTGVDIMPVGTIPPNPTELLSNGRLERLVEALRADYDYIFLDCPPAEILADTALIAKYADITIFILRANLLERNILPQIEKMYIDKKFNNMTTLLNGTETASGYGYYKYGYSYGYHYGYGDYYSGKGEEA